MQRRDLLQTVGFVAGLVPASESASAAAGRHEPTAGEGRWFLDWLPPSLGERGASYSFGAAPDPPTDAGTSPFGSGGRNFHLVTDHAKVHVSVGADAGAVRDSLRTDGYERLSSRPHKTYGKSIGRRYRVVALDDEAVTSAVGPAAPLVRDRVETVAGTDGSDPGGVLARTLEHVLPARRLSVDVRPVPGIAGVGERIVVDGPRSRLLTAVVPDSTTDGMAASTYLNEIETTAGVSSTSVTRRGRALVREATVRTDSPGPEETDV